MASGRSPRRLLQFFKPTDAPTLSAYTEALASQLDNDVECLTGKLSERSVAKLFGRLFYVQGDATAVNNGVLWLDTGATWVIVGQHPEPEWEALKAVSEAEAFTGFTASARPSTVSVIVTGTVNERLLVIIAVGAGVGVNIAQAQVGGSTGTASKVTLTFPVPAGQKWKLATTLNVSTIQWTCLPQ